MADAKGEGLCHDDVRTETSGAGVEVFEFHAAIIRGARGDECADSGYCS